MTPARILAICRDEWPALRWSDRVADAITCGRGPDVEVYVLRPPGKLYVYVDVYVCAGDRFAAGSPPVAGSRALRRWLREARRLVTS